MDNINTIAIIGRPNVGKSTLFNTLIDENHALTSPNPGLTRDRNYAYFSPIGENKYLLIDTGGLILESAGVIDEEVNVQVDIAIDQADLLLFVVSISDGPMPMDYLVAEKIRVTSKPVLVVANKSDSPQKDNYIADFYKLGFDNIIPVSAAHRRNIYGLGKEIVKSLPESRYKEEESEKISLCMAGKPNVGKSTLVNTIVGENRVIVSDIPGTTRNPAKCYLTIKDRGWELIDLAGLWRKHKGKFTEEIISMLAARREIGRSDVCILILDLLEPLTTQDKKIAGWIIESGTSLIVVGNKADITGYDKKMEESYHNTLLMEMPFLKFAPFMMISAKEAKGINRLFTKLDKVVKNTFKRIPDTDLNSLLTKIIEKRPIPEAANHRPVPLKLYQKSINPTTFNLIVRHKRVDKIPQHWKNYLRNSIYKEYDFEGVPVHINIISSNQKNK